MRPSRGPSRASSGPNGPAGARTEAEAGLLGHESFLLSIGDNLPDGMIYQLVRESDGTRRFTHVSAGVRRLHGCSPEEALADAGRVYSTVLPEDRLRVAAEEEAAHATLSDFRAEVRIAVPGGGVRWSSFASRPRLLPGGATCWDGVEIDITERKRAEEVLRASEDGFRRVSRLTSDFVFQLDVSPEGALALATASDGLARFTGLELRHLRTPEQWERLLGPEDVARLRALLGTLVADGGRGELEGQAFTGDGATKWFHLVAEAVRHSPAGRTIAIVGAASDVTERKRAEKENKALEDQLRAVNEELAAALRMKDEFLSSMSHELRTPLNAVLGFLQALRGHVYGDLSERLLRAAAATEDAGRHLLALISDILDLSKVQAGRLELEVRPVPIRSLCEASLQMVEKTALGKRIELGIAHDPRATTVLTDGRRLKQVLVNLLSNAVKFTPDGGRVDLSVSADPDAGEVRFSVEDTGIGIPADQLPRLFQPFTQVDSRLSRQHAGTGLGLSLVRSLTARLGGGLHVESRPGEGSRFTVSLPWSERPGTPAAPAPAPAPAPDQDAPRARARQSPTAGPLKVLVVEDNEANAVVFSDSLSASGYDVRLAGSALEGLRLLPSLKPDLVLMDIRMPGMDGLQAIRAIRSDEATAGIPVVAVTALAMSGDRERCLSAGADDYLTKPVDLGRLARLIESLAGHRGKGTPPSGGTS